MNGPITGPRTLVSDWLSVSDSSAHLRLAGRPRDNSRRSQPGTRIGGIPEQPPFEKRPLSHSMGLRRRRRRRRRREAGTGSGPGGAEAAPNPPNAPASGGEERRTAYKTGAAKWHTAAAAAGCTCGWQRRTPVFGTEWQLSTETADSWQLRAGVSGDQNTSATISGPQRMSAAVSS